MNAVYPRLGISRERLEAFCRDWDIIEFALFGSVVREDFKPESDIDVMVEFSRDAKWGLWDLVRLQRNLEELLHRNVDVVEKGTIRNPYRKKSIHRDLTVVYPPGEQDVKQKGP